MNIVEFKTLPSFKKKVLWEEAPLLMGIRTYFSSKGSPMLTPALKYLTLRSLGAPAVLLSLAVQGVFRGFKDTTTPLYATVAGDLLNIILDPILIFVCRLGVSGAAISHVISQYVIFLILLWRLLKSVDLVPPTIKDLQFGQFLSNGLLLLARVIAATICVTLAASLAARLGPNPMAAFQTCLQVWMTSSLLVDGLAVAGQSLVPPNWLLPVEIKARTKNRRCISFLAVSSRQSYQDLKAILACAFAEKDYDKATAAASRVLQVDLNNEYELAIKSGIGEDQEEKLKRQEENTLLETTKREQLERQVQMLVSRLGFEKLPPSSNTNDELSDQRTLVSDRQSVP